MDELPARAKAVLRRAQQHDECRDEDARRRVREGVARAVGAGVVPSVLERARAAAQPVAPAAGSAPLLGLGGKLTVTAVLVALIGSGVALRPHDTGGPAAFDTRASTAGMAAPGTAADTPAPSTLPSEPAVRRAEPSRSAAAARASGSRDSRHAHGAPTGARASTRDTLDLELRLLRDIDAALLRRDTREARRLLALHRERFTQPSLLEERQGFAALVGCMEGTSGALAAARAFVARYPSSVLRARVLHACEQGER